MQIFFFVLPFFSTFFGGLFGLRYKDKLHLILGFTAGVMLGVVAFDVLPQLFEMLQKLHISPTAPMVALIVGFLAFHIFEKLVIVHHSYELHYKKHQHGINQAKYSYIPMLSAAALSIHSFFDGVGIGLGFQVGSMIGILISLAVIAHDFSDGLNTIALMILTKKNRKAVLSMLLIDAIAPLLGAFSTRFFTLPQSLLVLYLAFFAGFLIYISTSEILPEAHSDHPSLATVVMTLIGVSFIFLVTRVI